MKFISNTKTHLFIFCAVLISFVFVGCDIIDILTGKQDNTSDFQLSLFSNAQNTTPVFEESQKTNRVSNTLKNIEWGSGNGSAIYSMYYTLRQYINSQHNGVIDRANIYKSMFDLESLVNSSSEPDNLLAESKVLNPPFNFGNLREYDSYSERADGNYVIAQSETTTQKNAIIGWHWFDEGNQKKRETGVAQISVNNQATDIDIDMVFVVDYDVSTTKSDYNIRLKLEGNPTTHEFRFQYRIGGLSMVASGVSQGSTNNYLFKMKGDGTPDPNLVYYFVFQADANETTLKNLNFTDAFTDPSLITDDRVASFKEYVVSTPFWGAEDILSDTKDLNKGTPLEGTIRVQYQ